MDSQTINRADGISSAQLSQEICSLVSILRCGSFSSTLPEGSAISSTLQEGSASGIPQWRQKKIKMIQPLNFAGTLSADNTETG